MSSEFYFLKWKRFEEISLEYFEHHTAPSLWDRRNDPSFIHLGGFLLLVHEIRTEVYHDLSSKWFKLAVFGVEH